MNLYKWFINLYKPKFKILPTKVTGDLVYTPVLTNVGNWSNYISQPYEGQNQGNWDEQNCVCQAGINVIEAILNYYYKNNLLPQPLLDFIKNNIDTAIQKLIKQELSQNQIDSIGSLIYNISIENFEKSELLIAINSDPNNMELISNKWEQFDKIKNKSEVKLFERIKKEVEYYFYGY